MNETKLMQLSDSVNAAKWMQPKECNLIQGVIFVLISLGRN